MLKRKSRKTKIKKRHPLQVFITETIFRMFLLGFVLYFIIVWGGKSTYLILSNLSYFRLSEVYVKNHFRLEGKDAFEFTRLKPGINLFTIKLSSLVKEIKERHPEYDDVVVKRVLPNNLMVLLKEREPIMQIKMVKFYPVDRNGFIIPYTKEIPYTDLPIIIGVEPEEVVVNSFSNSSRIKKAIEILGMFREKEFSWQKRVVKINLTSLSDISFFLDDGVEVKFGSYIRIDELERLSQVLDEIKTKSISPAFIDLRFRDVIIGPK